MERGIAWPGGEQICQPCKCFPKGERAKGKGVPLSQSWEAGVEEECWVGWLRDGAGVDGEAKMSTGQGACALCDHGDLVRRHDWSVTNL